ncbi:hypothetical protein LTR36_009574 [Oleoguttula mirabilis]|uniref:Uncharacterized protein n=1 Tax=Oleoguttula mirabilis TaxID=1507867 RepID=A0AAV9JVQ3_9PEZI|nr:hypothetical protein LTR36_009574 [Oleoguttula mirabilis]
MPHIVLLGTCDTKLHELLYLRSQILDCGGNDCKVTMVDVGRGLVKHEYITITQDTLTNKYAPKEHPENVSTLSRGDVIKYMIICTSNWLRQAYQDGTNDRSKAIHGIINAGGTGGTSLSAGVMRAVLPIGFPKLIVSTNASGDVGPVVGEADITMMYSVCDIAGLNYLLRRILSNAAGAVVGMAQVYERSLKITNKQRGGEQQKKRVGLTMFGVTTPCVDKIRQYLEEKYPIECFVFHCTGAGGRAMERLVTEGVLDAVLDVTTTEICDQLCGGVMDAGPHRLEAPLKAGIPYVISVGATDMVNFGPRPTVPERYNDRTLFEHNPTVTLMRTSPGECAAIGEYIVKKVKTFAANQGSVQVVLPKGGVSMIATPGGPFHDAEADEALFSAILTGLGDTGVRVLVDERAVNDEGFAVDIAERLVQIMDLSKEGRT